jgi:transposase InsO family protein
MRSIAMPRRSHQTESLERLNKPVGLAKGTPLAFERLFRERGLPLAIRSDTLSEGAMPNDLWCADFKGEFKLGNGRYCYPLTVTDHASRFLLLCEALESTREDLACTVC